MERKLLKEEIKEIQMPIEMRERIWEKCRIGSEGECLHAKNRKR